MTAMAVDLGKLKVALKKASRDAFSALMKAHAGERLYAFALYTEGLAGYILPTANSEEALDRTQAVRWSPCDWDYHLEGEKLFAGVNRLLKSHDPDAKDVLEETESILGICVEVLQELDREGHFGSGATREALTLGILMGDQSDDERIDYVRKLNSKKSLTRFKRELAQEFDA